MIKLDLFEVLAACLGKDLPKVTRDLIEEVLRIALEANKKGDAGVMRRVSSFVCMTHPG